MDIVAVLLILAVCKNSEVMCDGCSLLPGGAPPCFPGAVDYAKQVAPIKEITYKLEENKEFVYHLKSGEIIVKLGERWVKSVGSPLDKVVCERDVKTDAYLKEFKTKFERGTIIYYPETFDGETNFYSDDVDSYFVTTKREVWICKSKAASSQSLRFQRVVTELLSRRSVQHLYFYDGIKATFVPFPGSNIDEEEKSIMVREIKYLDPESHEMLKYEGFLEFHHPENIKEEDYSIFKPLTEFTQRQPDSNKLTDVSETGIDLVYNKVPKTVIGNRDDVAECEMKVNDENLYSMDYLNQWSLSTNINKGGRALAKLPNDVFRKNFIITKHELWSCKIRKLIGGSTFEMSVLEYIGVDSIKSVEYIDGIELWYFQLQLGKLYQSAAIRETAYIDNNFEYVKYRGKIEKSLKHESAPSWSAEKPPQQETSQ